MAKSSNRREFLTGRAVGKELRNVGDGIADAMSEGEATPVIPVARETVRLETTAMGCPWCIIMNPGPPQQVMAASDAFLMVHDCEQMLTVYRDDSEIAIVNRDAFQAPVEVSPELFAFLITCRELFESTEGSFDPTAGALIDLWKAARVDGTIPDNDAVQSALARTGMQHVGLDDVERTVRFGVDGLKFDFGAIGKGDGIDKAAEYLTEQRIDSYLIHGGHSSLFARGTHAQHDGWPVGIKNPLFTNKRYATLILKDQGMATSGSNIQFFRHQGQRYGHILDPKTGQPADRFLSVTVLAPTAIEADAISTAFYSMGLESALQYCDDHPSIGAILIPHPEGRILQPVIKNIPRERFFLED